MFHIRKTGPTFDSLFSVKPSDYIEHFPVKFAFREIKKPMTGAEMLENYQPVEWRLGEILYALRRDKLHNSLHGNLFYVKDHFVSACWYSDKQGGWGLAADNVQRPEKYELALPEAKWFLIEKLI